MRISRLVLATVPLVAIAAPAFAQASNSFDVSWAALDPGNDWAAQVVRSIFPVPGGTPGTSTGNEATVIQQIAGQFTGFIAAIAAALVAYNVIVSIHRAAETSQILGTGQSWMFVVRVGFAGVMMFPTSSGFSAGQALVVQSALIGVGMAKSLYATAVKAVGPDAIVIAQPMIPGTQQIVAGLIENELCMDLVNLAANVPLVPIPQPITVNDNAHGGYITYRYALSTGNGLGQSSLRHDHHPPPDDQPRHGCWCQRRHGGGSAGRALQRFERLHPQPGGCRRPEPLADQAGLRPRAPPGHLQ